jgi:hypothetical protein
MTSMNATVRRLPRGTVPTAAVVSALLLAGPIALGASPDQYQTAPYQEYDQAVPAYVDDRDWSDEVPAHISAVDGRVDLEREGRVEVAEENLVLLAGDRLRTARGRAEILFADGSAIAIDDGTTVDLLDDSLLRLIEGRIRLAIARGADRIDYRVDTAAGSALIGVAGEYRLTLGARGAEPEFTVAVLRGSAELSNERGRTIVRAGTYASTTPAYAPSLPYAFNAAAYDAFDRWAEDQADARLGYASTRYLPEEIGFYAGAFDRYGDWRLEGSYGYVWYPRVDVGWRPYHHGRWAFYGRFGWTWIGAGAWSWPTHHYGRWGYAGSRWFWIPHRRWAPAWVAWASAPGYVGWCPLGFDNRPVISITNITVINNGPRWHGWSVVPDHPFRSGNGFAVSRYAIGGSALGRVPASRFSVRAAAPEAPAASFSRGAPLRGPAFRSASTTRGTAVTRGSAIARDGGAAIGAERRLGARAPAVGTTRGAVAPAARGAAAAPPRSQISPAERRLGAGRPSASAPSSPSRSTLSREPAARPPASRPSSPSRSVVERGVVPRSGAAPPARRYDAGRTRAPQPAAPAGEPDRPGRAIGRSDSRPSPPASASRAPSRIAPSRAFPPSGGASAPDRPASSSRPSAVSRSRGGGGSVRSEPPAPGASAPRRSAAPSRAPSSAPSRPAASAPPSRGGDAGARRAAPSSSSDRGRAVRRTGGGGQL